MIKNFENIHTAYELLDQCWIEEMQSYTGVLRHKKTGARLVVASNDDNNKVFTIGFRTPPKDSTGVAHILEHCVLCGSEAFPSKDPFVELVKGSLNTFLNAMTYADKTLYPAASYNDKDFENLMHVYMDAVFYPNIYKNEKIFRQEGWHYELENEDSPITYNGVVYNEMKGAFSSPEQVLMRKITSTLFPDTVYGVESGGEPEHIPELSYEQFLDFHKTYYHPSNSYIYLYGDMDVYERLDFMDRAYLSKFDYQPVDSVIYKQQPSGRMNVFKEKYSVASDEDILHKTYFSYNAVIGDSLDEKLYIAFQILDYVLMSAPGAVLKKALIDSGIAKDVFGSYDNGVLQPYYSIVAKDADAASQEAFLSVITKTLTKLVREGINRKSLEGALNYFEFRFREADFGRYPKGLMYGLQMFDSWLYDDTKPLIHMQAYKTFKFLRAQISTGYFEGLIQQYLINNPHTSLLILEPEQGLTNAVEEATAKQLAAYKDSLSKSAVDKLIEDTKALKLFQETPSTKEELEAIPMIEIKDIKREAEPLINEMRQENGLPILCHFIETNGIGYFKALFDTSCVPEPMLPYIGLLSNVLGNTDTENYSYMALADEVNMHTGGITTDCVIYQISHDTKAYRPKFEVTGKALFEKMDILSSLMCETLFRTKFDDKKRLKEIIAQLRSRLQMYFSSNGHAAAALRATAYYSEASYYKDMINGIGFYEFIKALDDSFDVKADEVIQNLKTAVRLIFNKGSVMFDYTANEESFEKVQDCVHQFERALYDTPDKKAVLLFKPEHKNEGFMTPGMVQYDAAAGNFMEKGFAYSGALQILKVIMNYDYLWNNIRVKGGAYGCMCSFTSSGNAYFTTYRDPNLKESYEVFKAAGSYIRNFECSQRDMTKYIIGAIGNIDTPLTPLGRGARSLALYLSGITYEDVQKSRDELLDATIEDIRGFGSLIDAFVEDNYICVVGSESEIKANAPMFHEIKAL